MTLILILGYCKKDDPDQEIEFETMEVEWRETLQEYNNGLVICNDIYELKFYIMNREYPDDYPLDFIHSRNKLEDKFDFYFNYGIHVIPK